MTLPSIESFSFYIHQDSIGITQTSLIHLRNEIINRFHHHILVFKYTYNYNHPAIVGFGIVDFTTHEIILCGNGFREDRRGEGGAGLIKAERILNALDIPADYEFFISSMQPKKEEIINALKPVDKTWSIVPAKINPQY